MSDTAWMLEGVDPEALKKAAEEADRLGISVDVYLTTLLGPLLKTEHDMPAPAPESATDSPPLATPLQDSFAIRHHLATLERRLNLAVGGLDTTAQTLDRSMSNLSERVYGAESLAAETAQTLNKALSDVDDALASVRARFAQSEEYATALRERQDQARDALADRCAGIDHKVTRLGDAQEALKHAVAADFSELSHQNAQRIETGLDEIRAAADAAADHANEAAQRLITELRAVRQTVDARLAQSAAETRQRMQTAFAESAMRVDALAARVSAQERVHDQIRAQINDAEDAAQTALEETAETLRQAGAALAAETTRSARDTRAAIENVHADLSVEIAGVRDQNNALQTRQRFVDAALADAAAHIEKLREETNTRVAASEQVAAEAIQAAHAETERVEACTFASLTKLADDISDLRDAQGAVAGRLKFLDKTLASLESGAHAMADRMTAAEGVVNDRALEERLQRLETAARSIETEQALAVLRDQLTALSALVTVNQIDPAIMDRVETLGMRLVAAEVKTGDAAGRIEGLAGALRSLGTEYNRAVTQSNDRMHRVELALEQQRSERASASAQSDAVRLVEQRVAAFEARQVEAFETLRADIAAFLSANDQRLAAIETDPPPPDIQAFATEFDALRRRIEERVLDVEARSVQALEQVADTMSVLEQRFAQDRDSQARSA